MQTCQNNLGFSLCTACYKLKNLVFVQEKEPCIGLTQENSIESSVQDSLPYIPWTYGLC